MTGLKAEVGRQFAPILKRHVRAKLLRAAREVEAILVAEFNAHPITKEIEGGASAGNISGTLGGYGNLFTYIGFSDSDHPVEILRVLLKNSLNVRLLPPNGKKMIQEAVISLPSKEELEAASPMPWASGRSWAKGVEQGISGLGRYLRKESSSSRSGGGVQSDKGVRSGGFKNTTYLSGILENLRKNIKTAVRKA